MTDTKPSLTEFLLARFAEEESAARKVSDALEKDPGAFASIVHDHPELAAGDCAGWLAEYDPARVLADVEAKRRIVELHAPEGPACSECGGFTSTTTPRGIEHSGYLTPWPCPTLRALAQPYAAHPEFRGEWAL